MYINTLKLQIVDGDGVDVTDACIMARPTYAGGPVINGTRLAYPDGRVIDGRDSILIGKKTINRLMKALALNLALHVSPNADKKRVILSFF